MTPSAKMKTTSIFLMLMTSSLLSEAAELVLKTETVCQSSLVRLNDVAEIRAENSQEVARLGRLELFAAPGSGRSIVLTAKELRELLSLYDVDATRLRITGAESISILPVGRTLPLQATAVAHQASAAIESRTSQPVNPSINTSDKIFVAVAKHTVLRGDTVRRGEVELRPINRMSKGFEYVSRVEDVLGREATRQLEAGQPVDARWLRQPVMVRRNETIVILASGAGVKVRTSAKALEDGSMGDVITVETLEKKNRQKFNARVTGLQEAEVYVGAHVAAAVNE